MTDYIARALSWERGWEVHIDGLGVTQCRTLGQAEQQALDYIETMTGSRDAHVTLTVEIGDLADRAQKARQAIRDAKAAETTAAAESRAVARALRERGLSVTDAAYVLGVSRGRVSQLVND